MEQLLETWVLLVFVESLCFNFISGFSVKRNDLLVTPMTWFKTERNPVLGGLDFVVFTFCLITGFCRKLKALRDFFNFSVSWRSEGSVVSVWGIVRFSEDLPGVLRLCILLLSVFVIFIFVLFIFVLFICVLFIFVFWTSAVSDFIFTRLFFEASKLTMLGCVCSFPWIFKSLAFSSLSLFPRVYSSREASFSPFSEFIGMQRLAFALVAAL